jgi:hypothetical protein
MNGGEFALAIVGSHSTSSKKVTLGGAPQTLAFALGVAPAGEIFWGKF